MKYEDVVKAKNNLSVYNKIYKDIFFDKKGNAKLRLWLLKMGVKRSELDNLESIMSITFVECMNSYRHGKISFEKYVWTKFKFSLYNYFYRKNKVKKIANEVDLEDYADRLVCVQEHESIDFDFIVQHMTDLQSLISKLKYYNDCNDYEIMELCNISKESYDDECLKIRNKIKEYSEDKL